MWLAYDIPKPPLFAWLRIFIRKRKRTKEEISFSHDVSAHFINACHLAKKKKKKKIWRHLLRTPHSSTCSGIPSDASPLHETHWGGTMQSGWVERICCQFPRHGGCWIGRKGHETAVGLGGWDHEGAHMIMTGGGGDRLSGKPLVRRPAVLWVAWWKAGSLS